MTLIVLLLVIILAGLGLWALGRFVPMDPALKQLLTAVVVVVVLLLVLEWFGLITWTGHHPLR